MVRHFTTFLLVLFTFAACSNKDGQRCSSTDTTQCVNDGTGTRNTAATLEPLACTVVPSKSQIASGENVALTITATGGTGLYSVPQFISSFSGTTTISGTYVNNGTTIRAVQKTVYITDSAGSAVGCDFNLTVLNSSATRLQCSITPSRYNPKVGENVDFVINAWNGTSTVGTYTFTNEFYPRTGETARALTSINGAEARVSHIYTAAGYADPHVMVTDAYNSSVWCEVPNRYLYVAPKQSPKLTANIEASTLDADGNTVSGADLLRVIITPLNFTNDSPITYSYTSVPTGISVKQDANWNGSPLFFFKRTDGLAKDFSVTFTGVTQNGLEAASITVRLIYRGGACCTMAAPSYAYVGKEALIAVSSHTGESLEVSNVVVPSGVTYRTFTSGNKGQLGLTFSATGTYTVRFKSRSTANTANYCNGGSEFSATIVVYPAASSFTGCEVETDANMAYTGVPVRIDVSRNGGIGDISAYQVTVITNGSTATVNGPYVNGIDTQSVDMKFFNQGTFKLQATMKETATGKSVVCESYIKVDPSYGLKTRVFGLPTNASYPLTNHPNLGDGSFPLIASFDSANINVSPRRSDCNDRKKSHVKEYGKWAPCAYPGVPYGRTNWYAVEYTGFIDTSVAGTYNFQFKVDDGVALYIDDVQVLMFDGIHGPQSTGVFSKSLSAGTHKIKVNYFQGPAWQIANVFMWQKPNSGWEIVPVGVLHQ